MAFTEASLLADLQTGAPMVQINKFIVGASYTDVYVTNYNETSRKAGWTQVDNTNTAAQAHSAIEAKLNA